jgi:hypothetical protein
VETNTNSRNFRENLSYFFDKAASEAVAINRGQDRYILLSESDYLKMREEVMVLQRSLISSLQIQNGEGVDDEDFKEENDDALIARVSKQVDSSRSKKKKVS